MRQNITVIVRTLNEEHRIGAFCKSYEDAHRILVADGGSTDDTLYIAGKYPNVRIRKYEKRVELANGYWRNCDADHVNFLIDWAKEYSSTWVINDDVDCRPNYLLKRDYRKLLEETDCDYVLAVRLYIWSKDQHFPHMAKPEVNHEKWEASLWAWRGNQDFHMVNVPPAFTFRIGDLDVKDLRLDANTLEIMPPYALLHYSWDNPERVMQKITRYRDSGFIPGMKHPMEFAGPLEKLPDWAKE